MVFLKRYRDFHKFGAYLKLTVATVYPVIRSWRRTLSWAEDYCGDVPHHIQVRVLKILPDYAIVKNEQNILAKLRHVCQFDDYYMYNKHDNYEINKKHTSSSWIKKNIYTQRERETIRIGLDPLGVSISGLVQQQFNHFGVRLLASTKMHQITQSYHYCLPDWHRFCHQSCPATPLQLPPDPCHMTLYVEYRQITIKRASVTGFVNDYSLQECNSRGESVLLDLNPNPKRPIHGGSKHECVWQ